jgi:hypothetical protein
VTFARGRFFKYHDSDDVMYPHCLEVMVHHLEAAPAAGLAFSAHTSWSGAPCPILSTPRLSYLREFLGYGIFSQGPASALFRTDVFRALGGFPLMGPHSDVAFWLRACRTTTVVLVPADLFWYRMHDGQHLQTADAAFDLARVLKHFWDALNHPECPLLPEEREMAKRNFAFRCAKGSIRAARVGRLYLAFYRIKQSGLRWHEWLRYLRRSQQSWTAGAPAYAETPTSDATLQQEPQL